jgi:integrase
MELKPRKPGGVLYVHFKDANGDRQRLSTDETDHARAQVRALEIMRSHLVDILPKDAQQLEGLRLDTLGACLRHAWAEQWSTSKSAHEYRTRVGKIVREIGHWPVHTITKDRLKKHLDSLQVGTVNAKDLQPATKNRYVSCIHVALTFCKEPGFVMPDMPQWDEHNEKDRYVTLEEEKLCLDWFTANTAPGNTRRQYMHNLFIVLIDTGMRCGEALEQVTRDHLHKGINGRYRVHLKAGQTKSNKGRVVPLTARAEVALLAMLDNPLHGTWTSRNAHDPFVALMKVTGIQGVTLHTLRHTCATRLAMSGKVSLDEIRIWLGHSSAEVTKRYVKYMPGHLDNASSVLDAFVASDVPPVQSSHPIPTAQPTGIGTENRPILYAIK